MISRKVKRLVWVYVVGSSSTVFWPSSNTTLNEVTNVGNVRVLDVVSVIGMR